MAAPDYQYTINRFPGDGSTTSWEINFAGGYLIKAHVKGYVQDATTLEVLREITFVDSDWIGPNTVRVIPAVAEGERLTIYRDTPKDFPLVSFSDGSIFIEKNLDTLAKQAVFIAAEMVDRFGDSVEESNSAAAAAQTARDAALAAQAAADSVAANFAALQLTVNSQLSAQNVAIAAFEASVNAQIAAFEASVAAAQTAFEAAIESRIAGVEADVAEVLDAQWRTAFVFYAPDRPDNNTTVFSVPVARKLLLPEDFAGSRFHFVGNPNADVTFTLYRNGVAVGTIEIAGTSGLVTLTADETEFEDGDIISLTCTHAASSGASQIGFNIVTRIIV